MRLTIIILVLMLASCGVSNRTSERKKSDLRLIDEARIEKKSPGDKIFIAIPQKPKDRPKSTTRTYSGNHGATTNVVFDSTGTVNTIVTDCPPIDEVSIKNLELDYSLKEKLTERKANIEIVNKLCETAIWISVVFAIAWIIRSLIPRL